MGCTSNGRCSGGWSKDADTPSGGCSLVGQVTALVSTPSTGRFARSGIDRRFLRVLYLRHLAGRADAYRTEGAPVSKNSQTYLAAVDGAQVPANANAVRAYRR